MARGAALPLRPAQATVVARSLRRLARICHRSRSPRARQWGLTASPITNHATTRPRRTAARTSSERSRRRTIAKLPAISAPTAHVSATAAGPASHQSSENRSPPVWPLAAASIIAATAKRNEDQQDEEHCCNHAARPGILRHLILCEPERTLQCGPDEVHREVGNEQRGDQQQRVGGRFPPAARAAWG